jgi:hypothetical protein
MWQAMLQSAQVDWLRTAAEHRLLQLQALDNIDELQVVVDGFTRETGSPPADWRTLVRAGRLRGFPLDPNGTPYGLTPAGLGARHRRSIRCPPSRSGRTAPGDAAGGRDRFAAAFRRSSAASSTSASIGAERHVDRLAGVGVPALRPRAGLVRKRPALSYAVLRGGADLLGSISMRYPTVEALTAAMFALGWWYLAPGRLAARLLLDAR